MKKVYIGCKNEVCNCTGACYQYMTDEEFKSFKLGQAIKIFADFRYDIDIRKVQPKESG